MVYSFINLISPYALRFKPPKVCFGRLVILLCKRWQSWVNGYDYVDQIREMWMTTQDDERDLAPLNKSTGTQVSIEVAVYLK